MNKVIIISIRPQHAANILNSDKTLELRKSLPKDIDGEISVKVELVADKDITEEERLAFNFAAEGV